MALAALLCLPCNGSLAENTGNHQVYLIQNSGWMEPFYTDGSSEFLPLVRRVVEATAIDGGRQTVATFNQAGQLSDRRNPHVLYSGQNVREAAASVSEAELPKRADGAYTDADFGGSVKATITRILDRQSGVIWIFTNNKNAPNNDPKLAQNLRSFFDTLKQSSAINRLIAYLKPMDVQGRNFSERGLVVYGIAYDEAGARALEQVSHRQQLRRLFGGTPPVLLKPLGEAPLRFEPEQVRLEGASVSRRGTGIAIQGLNGAERQTVTVVGTLFSEYYPYRIEQANLSVAWRPVQGLERVDHDAQIVARPSQIRDIPAMGSSKRVALEITFPAVPRPDGVSGLLTDTRQVLGAIRLRLTNLKLSTSPSFENKMNSIAEAQNRAQVFFDFESVQSATTVLPLGMTFEYSPWPIILLVAALFLVCALGLLTVRWLGRRPVRIQVDGYPMSPRLRAGESTVVENPSSGRSATVTRRLFSGPKVDYRVGNRRPPS